MWVGKGTWILVIILVLSGISVIATVISIIEIKKDGEDRKAGRVVCSIIPCVSILATLFTCIVPEMREYVFYNGSAEELEQLETNQAELIAENSELQKKLSDTEIENSQQTNTIENLETQLSDSQNQIKDLTEANKYNVSFENFQLYNNGNEVPVNQDSAFAMVAGSLYFSEAAVEALEDNSVNIDKDNKFLYIGKYPEKTVDLLSVCEPYDITNGNYFALGKDSPFKIQGKTYSNGFQLSANHQPESVSFNLDSQYSEMIFHIGHVDDTKREGTFTITPYLDTAPGTPISVNLDTNSESELSIPLNHARILKLEWSGDASYSTGSYGLFNIRLK